MFSQGKGLLIQPQGIKLQVKSLFHGKSRIFLADDVEQKLLNGHLSCVQSFLKFLSYVRMDGFIQAAGKALLVRGPCVHSDHYCRWTVTSLLSQFFKVPVFLPFWDIIITYRTLKYSQKSTQIISDMVLHLIFLGPRRLKKMW